MRRLLPVLLAGLLLAPALPVSAIRCVADPTMTPEELVEGDLVSGQHRYDFAMVARIRETGAGDPQQAEVDLFGAYGVSSAPVMATVTFHHLGDAGGSVDRLVVGVSYFIPVLRVGPGGETNYATTCDPITEIAEPESAAVELAVIADNNGVDFSLPQQEGASGGPVTFVVIAALLLLLVWTFSRRRAGRERLTPRQPDSHREP